MKTMISPTTDSRSLLARGIHTALDGSYLDLVMVGIALLALYATITQTLRATGIAWTPSATIAIVSVVSSIAIFLLRASDSLLRAISCLCERIPRMSLWTIGILGVALRLAWILLFPTAPSSDGAVYLRLAHHLAIGLPYEIVGTKAYWPPGYPIFLAPWIHVLENLRLSYLVSNFALFALGLVGIARLATELANSRAGRIAATLFAIWPNLISNIATPEKELLVLALVVWATLFLIQTLRYSANSKSFLTGLLLGAGILVQPSLQLLPICVCAFFFASTNSHRTMLTRSGLLLLGSVLVISPWTIRNYQILDRFVLVATNGGDNFYRANNPQATGGYTSRGEHDLAQLSELERDAEGRKLGMSWIKANPRDFVSLMFEKQIRFMGDDSVGVYNTFREDRRSVPHTFYVALKLLTNSWWIFVWLLIAVLAISMRKTGDTPPPLTRSLFWSWLYLFGIHSVFESAGKYHVPMLWVPCIIIAIYINVLDKTQIP